MTAAVRSQHVMVFTGLPGTGKSTIAEAVARRLAIPCFAGDWLFGAMAPTGVLNGVPAPILGELQQQMLGMLALRQLALGQSAIIDGLFSQTVLDAWAADIADAGGSFDIVQCICSDDVVHRRRLETRVRGIPGWHEVDWDHVLRVAARFPAVPHPDLVLDAISPIHENVYGAIALWSSGQR